MRGCFISKHFKSDSHHLLGCNKDASQPTSGANYTPCFVFWCAVSSKRHQGVVGGRTGKKRRVCFEESSTKILCKSSSLESWPCCNNSGFVINQSQKRLINHNIHEAAVTEWEWPWLLSQCAYASPGVKENQRGHSPGDLGQRHHPHLSQTSGLNQHLETLWVTHTFKLKWKMSF